MILNELSLIKSAIPDYKERAKKAKEDWEINASIYYKAAHALCSKYNLDFLSVNSMSYGEDIVSKDQFEKNIQNDTQYYHISTKQGYYYIVDDNKSWALFNGKTKTQVGLIDYSHKENKIKTLIKRLKSLLLKEKQ